MVDFRYGKGFNPSSPGNHSKIISKYLDEFINTHSTSLQLIKPQWEIGWPIIPRKVTWVIANIDK
jgi:hypothetical protein